MTDGLGTASVDSNAHCPSDPLVTGDGFRSLCRHRCTSEGCQFYLHSLRDFGPNECVFVEDRRGKRFTTLRPVGLDMLNNSVVLITHNSDVEYRRDGLFRDRDAAGTASCRTPNARHWCAQNCNWPNRTEGAPRPRKLSCLPIGIENRYNFVGMYPDRYFEHMGTPQDPGRNVNGTLLVAFGMAGPDRTAAIKYVSALGEEALSSNGGWITRHEGDTRPKAGGMLWGYWASKVRRHRFTLSPHGHGLDCHRTWEVLLLGGVPVVRSSSLDGLYDGLPVVIVNRWEEVTEGFLAGEWERMRTSRFRMERLFFGYWSGLIEERMMDTSS